MASPDGFHASEQAVPVALPPQLLSKGVSGVFKRPTKSPGSTAFNATFSEHEESLGVDLAYSIEKANDATAYHAFPADPIDLKLGLQLDKVELGITIL